MLKKIFYSFSIYTLTTVICAGLNIFILPVLTKYLSEKDYGTSALFSTYVMIVSPIIGLSSGGFFWISFFKKEISRFYQNRLFSTYFWFVCLSTVVISLLFLVLYPVIRHFSVFSLFFILLIPATSLVSVIGEETRSYFINNKKPLSYFVYSVTITFLELALSWYFVVYVVHSWEGRIYAWIISLLVQFIITLWLFGAKEKYIQLTFSKIDLLSLAAFGYPLIFHQLGKFVINQSDRLFIAKMVSIDEAGIYSIGYSLGSMMLLPIGAFSNFYTPFVYERLRRPDYEKKVEIVKTAYLFCLMIMVSFAMVILLSPWFFNIFIDQKFHKGLEYVPWVALSYVFWGFYILLTAVIFYKGKTTFLGWLSLLNIILNCILNIVLIRIYGAIGAAFATAISFFVVFVLTAMFSSSLMPLPWLFFLSDKKKND